MPTVNVINSNSSVSRARSFFSVHLSVRTSNFDAMDRAATNPDNAGCLDYRMEVSMIAECGCATRRLGTRSPGVLNLKYIIVFEDAY